MTCPLDKLANANQSIGIMRIAANPSFREFCRMDWKAKLRKELDDRGLEMKAVSISAGLGETYLFDVLKRNRSSQRPNLVALRKIATALGHPPDWLLNETDEKKVTVISIPVRGSAQAGVWREHDELNEQENDEIPAIPGRWAHAEQFAFRVAGASMDRVGITDGTFVVCVPYFVARTGLTDRDIVVVERRRGQTTERTVKRLKLAHGSVELWPESTDPRFQSPVLVVQNGEMHDETGTEVEVIGLVIGRFAPM